MPTLARHPAFTRPRRGTMLVGVLIALSLFMLLVGAVVMSGARDNMQSVDRFAALRAEYNAEAAANMAIRELVLNSDIDSNGNIGTFNPANVATLNGGTMTSSASVAGNVTTIDIAGRATGTNGSTATTTVASNNRLAVRRATGSGRPGLFLHAWEGAGWMNISSVNWTATPTFVGWVPNIDYSNRGSGEGVYRSQASSVNLRFLGRLNIPTTGTWGFQVDHDDGVELLINGVRVIFFDPGTGCRADTGSINLSSGTHDFELRFNDGGGAQCLTLYWTPPSGSTVVIPPSAFSHIPTEATPPLYVAGSATIAGDGASTTLIQGWRNISGPWTGTPLADSATIYTDTNANGSITMSNSARLEGIAYSPVGSTPSSVIVTSSGATMTGGRAVVPRRPIIPMVYVPVNYPAGSEGSVSFWGSTFTLSGDRRFNSLTIGTTSVATVSGNARIVVDGDLTIQDTARLVVPSGATLDIYVAGTINFWTSAQANTSGDPDRLRIYRTSNGAGAVNIYDNARVHAHIVCPYGTLNLYDNNQTNNEFVGTFRGNAINIDNNSKVRLDIGPAPGSSGSGGSTAITSWLEP